MLIQEQYNKFTGNLDRAGNTKMFFIIEEAKETISIFHKKLLEYRKFVLLWYNIYIKLLNLTL